MNTIARTALVFALVLSAACSDDDTKDKDMGTCTGTNCIEVDMPTTADMAPDQTTTTDLGPTEDMPVTADMPVTVDMPADQGVEDMGMTYPPAETCAELTLVECFSSAGCGADERCQNLEGKDPVPNITCCVKGARGAGAAGDACTTEFDCESGLCIDGETCSKECTDDSECPTSLPKCNAAIGVCRPAM
jgi:hypothetical protein